MLSNLRPIYERSLGDLKMELSSVQIVEVKRLSISPKNDHKARYSNASGDSNAR